MEKRTIFVQLMALVSLGVFIFFYRLGYPSQLIFDETYHIPAAQKYLNGIFFQENHPPLGKLFIAVGERLWHRNLKTDQFITVEKVSGDIPNLDFFGYRFFPALFGLATVIVVFFIFRLLIPDRLMAFGYSLLVLLDNALIIQARSAMLDSFLNFFVFLTIFLCLVIIKSTRLAKRHFLLLGLTAGGAILVKHTGWIVLVAFIPVVIKVVLNRKSKFYYYLLILFISFGLTYLSVWKIHYSFEKVVPRRSSFQMIKDAWTYSYKYNEGVPSLDMKKADELGSPWYFWPFGGRGISYRWEDTGGGRYRHLFLLGNPSVWLVSFLGVVFSIAWLAGRWLFGVRIKAKSSRFVSYFWLIYVSYMIPFLFIRRVMYLYHYLPAMILGLILFGLVLGEIRWIGNIKLTIHKKRVLVLVILGVVFFSFIVIAPITFYLPVTKLYMQRINLLPIWKTDFQER